jgi:uncharacterized membrane protein YkvI
VRRAAVRRRPDGYDSRMSNRAILIVALVLLAAGIVLAAVGTSVLVTAIGWALFGVALVILVSLMFLLVGQSEDRDRLRNPNG